MLRPKPRPHKLECASGSGTHQGEGDAGARCSNSGEFRHQHNVLRHGGLKPQQVGTAGRWSKTGSKPQRNGPVSVETGPTHEPFSWLKTTHKEANVSIGLIRATNVAKLANLTYFMKITNPLKTKQSIVCPTEREQPLHHFSGPSHAPVVLTAQTAHQC